MLEVFCDENGCGSRDDGSNSNMVEVIAAEAAATFVEVVINQVIKCVLDIAQFDTNNILTALQAAV